MPGRPRAIGLQAIDSDHYGLPAPGTGEDVIKQVGDNISSWLATRMTIVARRTRMTEGDTHA